MIDPNDAPRFTKQELLAVGPPETAPPDFDQFWTQTYLTAKNIDLDIEIRRIWSPDPAIEALEVHYTSWDGARIGGWVTHRRGSSRGMVLGHGYGGRTWFETDMSEAGYTAIFPCVRGFHLSATEELPWRGQDHVVTGIESRHGYILRGSVVDMWLAGSVLLELFPECAGHLYYNGGSFGGGLGALMLPFDDRYRAAHLQVPTFGHHPVRLQIPSTGSAEAVRLYQLSHPEVTSVLAYYDAATAASRISIPTLCSPALFDPAVTPPGQFAVANALPNAELFIMTAGHFEYPDLEIEAERLRGRMLEFFSAH
jgi:cephalosporin-C deacetylase